MHAFHDDLEGMTTYMTSGFPQAHMENMPRWPIYMYDQQIAKDKDVHQREGLWCEIHHLQNSACPIHKMNITSAFLTFFCPKSISNMTYTEKGYTRYKLCKRGRFDRT